MRNSRLYRFSFESLSFHEARWTRTRLLTGGLVLGIVMLCSLFAVNQYYGDIFGLGFIQNNSLVNENRVLQNQLQYLSQRLGVIQKQLHLLGNKGNELRLLADLPKLDEDLQKAGTGGTDERVDFTTSSSVNTLLNNLQATANQAEQELHLQIASYEAIGTAYDQNKVRFSHLPAIKPMEGFFNPHGYGMRLHPILNFVRKHDGIDIINEVGTPVYASAEGSIEFTGRKGDYGLAVEINHGYSMVSLYGHLSKILVHEGQKVKRGELIARSGNTGLSNGPHLHYEVRVNGVAQNPAYYIFDGVSAKDFQN
ncbi:MAG: M23 family metallopeptidase [Ignavibacteriae bacterium]|nr:MAG: M23 family metallopeptidase [Ignavibacteriota bacterium]